MSKKCDGRAQVDPSGVETYSLSDRPSKVSAADFRPPYAQGGSFRDFLDSLPAFLQAEDLRGLASAIAKAHREERVVALDSAPTTSRWGCSLFTATSWSGGLSRAWR